MHAVAAMLPTKPVGVGRPISDRTAWETLAALDGFRQIVADAERLTTEPIPEQPDNLYLEFSTTGNRTRFEAVSHKRRERLSVFALAECLEDYGRFIKRLEEIIEALCNDRTWVWPAHDGNLANFHGTTTDIDLVSSKLAWQLATVDHLLGDRLRANTRQLLRENVRKRVLAPFMEMIDGKRERNWWLETTNNWNAVCLAGVVGSALALVESPEARARFILAAQTYSQNFVRGFGKDGYCTEGLGYWNYGFGHYVMLAETIRQASGGEVDLLESDDVRRPAAFGARIEIMNGVYPAFSDCPLDVQPDRRLMAYVSRRYGLGLSQFENDGPSASGLIECALFSFPNFASGKQSAGPQPDGLGARTWFDSSGVLICRPGSTESCQMAVAIKGGDNAEHHNHNDVGAFIVVVGKTAVLLDPGAEVYTARTFSSKRYESNLINSYGHPVPIVAGDLQRSGNNARGQVLKSEFTHAADTLVLDITSAYAANALNKLTRTFVYSRRGKGSLTVTDEVEFSQPQAFGTALITLGEWQQPEPDTVLVSESGEAVLVTLQITGAEFDVRAEEIKEDVRTRRLPTRIGIDLRQPVTRASVTLKITAGG